MESGLAVLKAAHMRSFLLRATTERIVQGGPTSVRLLRKRQRPRNRGFKKSAETGHGSSAPLWLHRNTVNQGQILAVWILAVKLPNSDSNIAVDFCVDFCLLFFSKEEAPKTPPKHPPKNSLGSLFAKIPLGFLQRPFLDSKTCVLRAFVPLKRGVTEL